MPADSRRTVVAVGMVYSESAAVGIVVHNLPCGIGSAVFPVLTNGQRSRLTGKHTPGCGCGTETRVGASCYLVDVVGIVVDVVVFILAAREVAGQYLVARLPDDTVGDSGRIKPAPLLSELWLVPVESNNAGIGIVIHREILRGSRLVDTYICIHRGSIAVAGSVAHEYAVGVLSYCRLRISPAHLPARKHTVGEDNGILAVDIYLCIVEEVELLAFLAESRVLPFQRHCGIAVCARHLCKTGRSCWQGIVAHSFHFYVVYGSTVAQGCFVVPIRRIVEERKIVCSVARYFHVSAEVVGGRRLLYDVDHLDAPCHGVGGRGEQVDMMHRCKPALEPEGNPVGHAPLETQPGRYEPRVEAYCMILIHHGSTLVVGTSPLIMLPYILIAGGEPCLVVDLRPLFPLYSVIEILIVGDALRLRLQWFSLGYRLLGRCQHLLLYCQSTLSLQPYRQ